MGTGAPRHSPSTACMPTISLSFVMLQHHSISLTVGVYAHPITSGRQSRFEQSGLSH